MIYSCCFQNAHGLLTCDFLVSLLIPAGFLDLHKSFKNNHLVLSRGIFIESYSFSYSHAQFQGLDTVDANRFLSFPDDAREYGAVRGLLEHLGVESIALITNNPKKVRDLTAEGITVSDRINSVVPLNEHS